MQLNLSHCLVFNHDKYSYNVDYYRICWENNAEKEQTNKVMLSASDSLDTIRFVCYYFFFFWLTDHMINNRDK